MAKVACQPGDGAHVEVVRGLVEQQHVIGADEQPREVHAASLAAGERAHLSVPVHVTDELGDDAAGLGVGGPLILGNVAHDLVAHALVVIERV